MCVHPYHRVRVGVTAVQASIVALSRSRIALYTTSRLLRYPPAMLGTDSAGDPLPPPRAPLRASGKLPLAGTAARIRYLSSTISIDSLKPHVRSFVEDNAWVLQPERIHVCDGSEEENRQLVEKLQQDGRLIKLRKYDNW